MASSRAGRRDIEAQLEEERKERQERHERKFKKALDWDVGTRKHLPVCSLAVWEPGDAQDPECKCLKIDLSSLAKRVDDQRVMELFDPDKTGNVVYTAMRCKYHFQNKDGCRNGKDCKYCHVHGVRRNEPNGSQTVPVDPDDPKGRGRRLHKSERRARALEQGEAAEQRQDLWREIRLLVLEDIEMNIHLGRPIQNVHFVVWTVHRLLEDTMPMYSRASQMWGLVENEIGLWLGVDGQHRGAGHYPRGEGRAIHTLMKGFVNRLRSLARRTTAEYLVVMEADCRWQDGLAGEAGLAWLISFIQDHDFVWLGFFNNEWPTHLGEMYKDLRHYKRDGVFDPDLFPLFKADASGNRHPKYGSQAWSIRVCEIEAWCERMEGLLRPFGIDWFFMSPDHQPDNEVHFPSRSLAGQEPNWSDRKKGIARDVGRIEPTFDLNSIRMRSFGEPGLRGRRKLLWSKRVKQAADNSEMQREESYKNWLAGPIEENANRVDLPAPAPVPWSRREADYPGVSAVPGLWRDVSTETSLWADRIEHGASAMAWAQRDVARRDEDDLRAGREAALAQYMQQRDDAQWSGGNVIRQFLEGPQAPPPPPAIDLSRVPRTPPEVPSSSSGGGAIAKAPAPKDPPQRSSQAADRPAMKAMPAQPQPSSQQAIPPMPKRPAPTRGDTPPPKRQALPLGWTTYPKHHGFFPTPRGSIKALLEF